MSKLECVCSVNNMVDKVCNWKVDVLVRDNENLEELYLLQNLKTMIDNFDISEEIKKSLKQITMTSYYTTLMQKGISYEVIENLLKSKLDAYHNRPHRYNVVDVIYSELDALKSASYNLINNQAVDLESLYPTMELLNTEERPRIRR